MPLAKNSWSQTVLRSIFKEQKIRQSGFSHLTSIVAVSEYCKVPLKNLLLYTEAWNLIFGTGYWNATTFIQTTTLRTLTFYWRGQACVLVLLYGKMLRHYMGLLEDFGIKVGIKQRLVLKLVYTVNLISTWSILSHGTQTSSPKRRSWFGEMKVY